MMCSHLCFPAPTQLPGPETKLFVDQACIAVCLQRARVLGSVHDDCGRHSDDQPFLLVVHELYLITLVLLRPCVNSLSHVQDGVKDLLCSSKPKLRVFSHQAWRTDSKRNTTHTPFL